MPTTAQEQAFARALREIESGIRHDGLWGMSFAEAMGDEQKAKAIYLSKRASELMEVISNEHAESELEKVIRNQGLLSFDRDTKEADDLAIQMYGEVTAKTIECHDAVLNMYGVDAEHEKRFQNRLTKSEIFVMEGELFYFYWNEITSRLTFRIYNPSEVAIDWVLFLYKAPRHTNYFFCNLGLPLLSKRFGVYTAKLPFNWFLRHGYRREVELVVKGAR